VSETEEVFDVVLPADDQAAKVVEPGNKGVRPAIACGIDATGARPG